MALITITEAAKLTGKGRPAIYAAIKATPPNNLSVITDNGKKMLDPAEVQRVFGPFKNAPTTQGAALGDETEPQPDQSALAVAELRAENAGLKARIVDMTDHIQTLKNELSAAKEREIRLLPTQAAAKGFFARLFGGGS